MKCLVFVPGSREQCKYEALPDSKYCRLHAGSLKYLAPFVAHETRPYRAGIQRLPAPSPDIEFFDIELGRRVSRALHDEWFDPEKSFLQFIRIERQNEQKKRNAARWIEEKRRADQRKARYDAMRKGRYCLIAIRNGSVVHYRTRTGNWSLDDMHGYTMALCGIKVHFYRMPDTDSRRVCVRCVIIRNQENNYLTKGGDIS